MIYLEPLSVKEKELMTIAIERNKTLASLRSSEPTPVSFEHQKKWVESLSHKEKYYFIYDSISIIGYCGLDKIDQVNSNAEISLLILEKDQGYGYGRKSVGLLLGKAFEQYHLNCVYGECYYSTENWKFWQKLGFIQDGTLKARKWWDGEFHNSMHFYMLASDWKILKKEFR